MTERRPLRPRFSLDERRFKDGQIFHFSGLEFRIRKGKKRPGDLVMEWRTPQGWRAIGYTVLGLLVDFFYENEHWLYPEPFEGGERLRKHIGRAVRVGWRFAALVLEQEKTEAEAKRIALQFEWLQPSEDED